MQKKVIGIFVIPLLILLFSIGFISAIMDCDVRLRTECQTDPWDNIIMGLSGLTNAHGELAFPDGTNPGTYPYVLCCNNGTGVGTTCTGENKLFGLSASTNAHAEIPEEIIYPVDVCYEDLTCKHVPGPCPTDKINDWYPIEMVSLSGTTDAHIATIDYYSINICCSSGTLASPPCDLTNAYWSFDGINPITEEYSSAFTGQEVSLVVEGDIFCIGETISFEVFEDDEGSCAEDLEGCINPMDIVFDSTSGVGKWTAQWYNDGIFGGNPEYYFIASVVSDPDVKAESPAPLLTVIEAELEDYCFEQSITSCGDYDEEYCGADICNVAEISGEFCGEFYCACSWNEINGICETTYSDTDEETGGTCTITQDILSDCETEPVGLFVYSWTGEWSGNESGSAYSQCLAGGEGDTIECPAQVQLPFFDFYHVIIALFVVALIYFLLIRKKQKKNSSKKRKKK